MDTSTNGAPQRASHFFRGNHYLVGLLLLINMFNFIDRQILFILAEAIKKDLGLSDTQIGVMGGAGFAVIYAVFGLPLARIADKYGSRWVLAGSLLVWSVLTACGGLARNFNQLLVTRLGVAAGEAGSTPAAHALIAARYPASARSLPLAVFALGTPLGAMFGLGLGGWVSDTFGWRQTLIVVGLPGILLAILVACTIGDPRPATVRERSNLSILKGVALLLSRPSFRHIAIAVSLYSISANASMVFAPPFLMRVQGMSASYAGLSLGLLQAVCGVAGTLAGGFLGDRLGARDARWRLWTPALALLIAGPFLLAAWLAPSGQLSVLLLTVPKFSNLVYMAPVFVALQTIVPTHMRALASAFLLMVMNLVGASLGPLIAGGVSDFLQPRFGDQSLRFALCLTVIFWVWAALHFFWGARYLIRDAAAASESGSTVSTLGVVRAN
jgi:MFS family permease